MARSRRIREPRALFVALSCSLRAITLSRPLPAIAPAALGFAALALAALVLAGCAMPAVRMPGPSKMPWAPQVLLDLETTAETVVESALSGDTPRAGREAGRVAALWPHARRAIAERHVDPQLLERVDKAVSDLEKAAKQPESTSASARSREATMPVIVAAGAPPSAMPGTAAVGANGLTMNLAAAPASREPSRPADQMPADPPPTEPRPADPHALDLAEKANAVTGYAAGFMNLFRMTIPAVVPTLDFEARAAIIQARAGEWKAVQAYVGALDGTMLAFFPDAAARRPENLRSLEGRLAAISRDAEAKDAARLERDARAFIDGVEKLREAYETGR